MASKIFQEDMEQIISDDRLPWSDLQDATVLVTGATGLIGSILVRALRAASNRRGLNLYILGIGRDKAKIAQLSDAYGADFVIAADIRKPFSCEALSGRIDYIFHCAAITKSADMVVKPVDVITTAVDGVENALDLAKNSGCRGFVYLSSMEVYGQTELDEVRETDLGHVDLFSPRSSYPESKRLCENLCIAYAVQHGVPVKIARLAQTFGAGTPRDDTRIFAQFARNALNGDDIVLHTQGKSRGNYSSTVDTISALLQILLKGNRCEAYNVANPKASVTIREMAQIVAGEVCGGKIGVVVEVPINFTACGYAPNIGYRLNVEKLSKLGWQPKYGLADMYRRMIADWRDL